MKNSKKHSRYGVLSLITFSLLLLFSIYIVYTDLISITVSYEGFNPHNRLISYIQTSIIFIISILGTVLGILGVLEQDKRKLLSVIGILLNGFITSSFIIATLLAFAN